MRKVGDITAIIGTKPSVEAFCEKHKLQYTSTHFIGDKFSPCPECLKEQERASIAEEKKLREKDSAKLVQSRIEKIIGHSAIPKRFRNKTISDYVVETDRQKAVVHLVLEYAKEFANEHSGRCLILYGNPGTGKTHLACAIAQAIMNKYMKTAVFTTVSRLARTVREAKSFDSNTTESQVIAGYVEPDLLIIDEVGKQSNTDAESRALFDVINERYEECKPTIFTSNQTFAEVKESLGVRVIDRARENGGAFIKFGWDGKRGDL